MLKLNNLIRKKEELYQVIDVLAILLKGREIEKYIVKSIIILLDI